MAEAYIVEAVRTPVTRKGTGLADVHPADLGAHALTALIDRSGIDPGVVEDVVFGCVDTIGGQAGDIARTCWLAGGLPEHVPGTTIDRQCGSSQQAIHFAAQGVMSGTQDVVVAGGVQSMSRIPISAAMLVGQQYGFPDPFSGSVGWVKRYGDGILSQFNSADMIAKKWDISRVEMEEYAYESHQRALRAIADGRFTREIAPVGDVTEDIGPRADTTLEKMAGLKTLQEEGRVTAAVSSQLTDGAAALLIVSEAALKEHGLTPRARIHHLSVLADDPVMMLTAPIP
ncbi:MAG: 3-ketoacyl-CoA thiolase/acetyl-CoA acetyltransferase, partial [Frankiales bacterium]|nr:3-ketoacyl-CoA thiolase/acetyl-CoA acetyltransferase [Frankiales bacterium]